MTNIDPTVIQATNKGDLFGHPRGLTVLFLTEMWEVFCFVGMRTLLIYYMTKDLMFAREQASLIYGFYTGIVYLMPLAGGAIADRWLGRRRSVLTGGSLMVVGQLMLMFPSLFYPALGIIAIGVGLFLPSLPSQIADLYVAGDPRKYSAYTVYYVGKNLGALLAALICGAIGEWAGWRWGFAAGAAGMTIGLIIYRLGASWLPEQAIARRDPGAPHNKISDAGRSRILLLVAVAGAVILFRCAYEQSGNSVALWLENGVDRDVGGWTIPMTWFQSLNPAMVFLLSPLLIAWWTRRARAGADNPVTKMAIGAGLLAFAFLFLAGAAKASADAGEQTSWVVLLLFFFLLTMGELYILPIGLGLFGRLAPPALTATTLGLWYCTSFAGNTLAGVAGVWAGELPTDLFFLTMSLIAALATLMLLACTRRAGKMGL